MDGEVDSGERGMGEGRRRTLTPPHSPPNRVNSESTPSGSSGDLSGFPSSSLLPCLSFLSAAHVPSFAWRITRSRPHPCLSRRTHSPLCTPCLASTHLLVLAFLCVLQCLHSFTLCSCFRSQHPLLFNFFWWCFCVPFLFSVSFFPWLPSSLYLLDRSIVMPSLPYLFSIHF